MDGCNTTRRTSCNTDETGCNTILKGFPRRCSLTSAKPSLLIRRHSEVTLQEIQKVKKAEGSKKSVLRRQYSTLSAPKIISERQATTKSVPEIDVTRKHDDIVLPRIHSASPEPKEVKMACQFKDNETFKNELQNGSYRPKYCWCFRCQLMYSMFKAGDDRLEMWGNYPCFKR